jgi:hypothetical protein
MLFHNLSSVSADTNVYIHSVTQLNFMATEASKHKAYLNTNFESESNLISRFLLLNVLKF